MGNTPSNGHESTRDAINCALIGGARSKSFEIVEKALEMGADVGFSDSFGMTAMHIAANANDLRMIQLLMRYGAMSVQSSSDSLSPLFSAVINGRVDAMDLLANYSLDLQQIRDGDRGMLEMVLLAEHHEAALWLITHGSDINQIDWRGDTLIFRMIEAGRSKAAILLAESGAYIDSRTIESSIRNSDRNLYSTLKNIAIVNDSSKEFHTGKKDSLNDEWAENSEDQDGLKNGSGFKPLKSSNLLAVSKNIQEKISEIFRESWHRAIRSNSWQLSRNTSTLITLIDSCQIKEALELLKTKGAHINVNQRHPNGMTLIQLLIRAIEIICAPSSGKDFDGSLKGIELSIMQVAHLLDGMGLSRSHIHARFPNTGNTALHQLMDGRGHSRICMHLLSLKSFKEMVNLSNNALSRPLHLSVRRHDPHLMSALVEAGACLNAFDRAGHTPLHMAAYMLEKSCAETAISLGANIHLNTRYGISVDRILELRKGESDVLRSMVHARKTIDSAKSIFSFNNPMAKMIRSKSKKN